MDVDRTTPASSYQVTVTGAWATRPTPSIRHHRYAVAVGAGGPGLDGDAMDIDGEADRHAGAEVVGDLPRDDDVIGDGGGRGDAQPSVVGDGDRHPGRGDGRAGDVRQHAAVGIGDTGQRIDEEIRPAGDRPRLAADARRWVVAEHREVGVVDVGAGEHDRRPRRVTAVAIGERRVPDREARRVEHDDVAAVDETTGVVERVAGEGLTAGGDLLGNRCGRGPEPGGTGGVATAVWTTNEMSSAVPAVASTPMYVIVRRAAPIAGSDGWRAPSRLMSFHTRSPIDRRPT